MIPTKKASILYILNILKDYSDINHLLKQKEIADKVYQIYGLEIERKTIASTLTLLSDLDYDIYKGPNGGYCLLERTFNESEIQFLIDAIYSSKIIEGNYAKNLTKKLSEFLSVYQRKNYSYLYKSTEISRTSNIEFFYNIEIINEAIDKNKKISFNYLSYDKNGNLIERKDGYRYTVSPYYMINNFGKYYLLCSISKFDNHSIYRIDYMKDIELVDADIKSINEVPTLNKNFKISSYINDHVYMFGGEIITATIEINEEWAITYIKDWYGNNANIYTKDGTLYASIKTDDRAFYYWMLQYGEYFTLLSPTCIADRLKNTYTENLKKYH